MRLTSANRWRRRHWPPDAMPRWCYEFVDSRLRRSPPDRARAVPYGQAGENALRFPHLAHRSAAAHKLHSTPQPDRMNLISGKGETSSRLPAFSLFLPGTCPNTRDRRRLNAVSSARIMWQAASRKSDLPLAVWSRAACCGSRNALSGAPRWYRPACRVARCAYHPVSARCKSESHTPGKPTGSPRPRYQPSVGLLAAQSPLCGKPHQLRRSPSRTRYSLSAGSRYSDMCKPTVGLQ